MKRIMILILVATLLLGVLYGCGGKKPENNVTNGDTSNITADNGDNDANTLSNSDQNDSGSKEKDNIKKAADNTGNTTENNTKKSSTSENNNISLNNSNYKILQETYAKGNIKITYPQLTNINDSKKQDSLNNILKNQALAVTNYYDLSNPNTVLKVSYDIQFQDNNNISILYKGDFNSSSSAYPVSVIYTSNIDLKDYKNIRLKDYADINEIFNKLRKLDSGSNIASTKDLADAQTQYLSTIADETLKAMLLNSDFSENDNNIQFPDVFSYKKNNNIIVSIPVPHVIGDYAEFVIKM